MQEYWSGRNSGQPMSLRPIHRARSPQVLPGCPRSFQVFQVFQGRSSSSKVVRGRLRSSESSQVVQGPSRSSQVARRNIIFARRWSGMCHCLILFTWVAHFLFFVWLIAHRLWRYTSVFHPSAFSHFYPLQNQGNAHVLRYVSMQVIIFIHIYYFGLKAWEGGGVWPDPLYWAERATASGASRREPELAGTSGRVPEATDWTD